MDATKKKKLVASLSFAKNFDELLGSESRAWFVERVIRGFEADVSLTDAQITAKTTALVALAKTRVVAERNFAADKTKFKLLADLSNKRFTQKTVDAMGRHRVEILYGAIAHEPKLAEPGQRDYLLFLARRRFRAVCRMFFWVNPNSQGYFFYPGRCKADQTYRVNQPAGTGFWQPAGANPTPIELRAAGLADPVAAINKLFVPFKSTPCNANIFDCAIVAQIMFIDSLAEAKTANTFLTALPSDYLHIGHLRYSRFSTDTTDSKNPVVTVGLPMPPRDLQVGDQCYIWNHPLYKTFRPTGSWRGEFAFVFASGDRNIRSKKGFVFGGHGKEGTLYKFYADFVAELSTHLALGRQLARVHLAFMAGGAAAIAPGTVVDDLEDDVRIFDAVTETFGAAGRHRLLAYDKTLITRDFTKVPTKAKRRPKKPQPGFLVVHSKTEHIFYIALVDAPDEDRSVQNDLMKRASELTAPRTLKHPIKIKRQSAPPVGATPAEIYAIEEWCVAFADHVTQTEKPWPFFETVAGKLKRKELTTDQRDPVAELFDSPFTPFTTPGADVKVVQPRVDFGPHRAFLAGNGAF